MVRRTRTVRDMRDMVEAAQARGLLDAEGKATDGKPRKPSTPGETRKQPPKSLPRLRVVWTVCDVGGRPVQQFDYPRKSEAEALAARLIEKGKGHHFVRSEKVPLTRDD